MIFTENSFLVRMWLDKVKDINSGIKIDDVPALFNLKEVVLSLLNRE
ncbi:hypothetical protein [Proteiniborus sp. MB09-C3]|nr:hypothetical protein [Proteiniborus sp. MB09-C3]WIV10553.1 hypothetical protein QO263_10315 [Proteiniborus sp. MB09-C3]